MSYGTIKVDTITFTDNSVDKSVSLSGLIQNPTFTGNITVTGTISGDVIRGGTTVSGATVTGTTANFVSGVFTTQISGVTVTGTTASFTSGVFTNISGTTATITSGIIASGTAAAPSLAILADLDTGLFSPGANELAVATNGTGRLFVDASGNVKIGSTDNSTVATTYVAIGNPGITPGGIQLWSTTAGNSYIQFGDGTSTTDQYRGYLGYVHSSDSLVFGTSTAERLRITSAGLVGVGTSSPGYKFEVDNTGGSTATARLIGNDQANVRLRIQNTGTSGRAYEIVGGLNGANNSHLSIYDATAAATRLTITETGLVGIGTSSPGSRLEIGGDASYDARVTFNRVPAHTSNDGVIGELFFQNNADSVALIAVKRESAIDDAYIQFATQQTSGGLSEKMRITSAGLVGIGTSSPSTPLEVAGAVGSGVISDYLSLYYPQSYGGGGSGPRMLFKANDIAGTKSTYAGIWSLLHANTVGAHSGKLVFGTTSGGNLVERLRIDESGNVGIGTTSASTILHVASTAPYIRIQDTDSSTGVTAQGGFEMYDNDGDRLFYLANESSSSSDVSLFNIAGGALKFGTSGSERGQFDSSGRLLVGTSTSASTGTSQYALLQVQGWTGASTGEGIFSLQRGESSSAMSSNDPIGDVLFSDKDGGNYARISAFADAAPAAGDHPGRLVFSTTADGNASPTGRAQIDNTGRFYTFAAAANDGAVFMSAEGAGTTYHIFGGWRSASTVAGASAQLVFQVFTNGNTQNTNNSYGGISDLKLKENVVDAGSQWSDIKELRVRKYNFKEKTGHETHTQIGLIAQEAELVSPGLVIESPDRNAEGKILDTTTKSVNYSVLYMKAVKALQEAMERIETLEGMVAVNNITIDEQQHQLSTLAARLTALETP
jgi:hypothetical protein